MSSQQSDRHLERPILCIVGARPNFTKIAPIIRAFRSEQDPVNCALLHTGQHYDHAMKASFFSQLGIPEPDIDLGVGSGTHAQQTAQIMQRFEPVVDELQPRAVLVVGDVNSTIACALVAAKKHVPVIHVEAGLRSFDRDMPEEVNRVLTDQISDILFTTEAEAEQNLNREGIASERVHFVGNVMIDTLFFNKPRMIAPQQTIAKYIQRESAQIDNRDFAVLTMHRPSNVDDPQVLTPLLQTIIEISHTLPVVFPMHPRTQAAIEQAGLMAAVEAAQDLLCIPPASYLEMLGLSANAKMVLTDSGGLQEETTALGVPCITLRHNTERPITVTQGTNTIVGQDPDKIRAAVNDVLTSGGKAGCVPPLWDGAAANRIKEVLRLWMLGAR